MVTWSKWTETFRSGEYEKPEVKRKREGLPFSFSLEGPRIRTSQRSWKKKRRHGGNGGGLSSNDRTNQDTLVKKNGLVVNIPEKIYGSFLF